MEGKIEATGIAGSHFDPRVAIASPAWQDLVVQFAEGSTAASRAFVGIAPANWFEITVPRAGVVRLWPAAAEAEHPRSVPRSRAAIKAAKTAAIKRAKGIIAGAPGGMLVPALRGYVREREPILSRADLNGILQLYRDLRGAGDNARTLASRESPK